MDLPCTTVSTANLRKKSATPIWPTARPISPWKWCNSSEEMVVYSGPITTPSRHTTSPPFFWLLSSSTRKSSTKQKIPHLPSKPSIIVRLLWAHSPHSFERPSPVEPVEVQAWVTPEAQPKTWRYKGVATPPIKKKRVGKPSWTFRQNGLEADKITWFSRDLSKLHF